MEQSMAALPISTWCIPYLSCFLISTSPGSTYFCIKSRTKLCTSKVMIFLFNKFCAQLLAYGNHFNSSGS
uniref:Putative secreted protein n=1 Tax=Panstrongylus lignarius TaxID=156445 RepID=A0A224Y173_9HEMI